METRSERIEFTTIKSESGLSEAWLSLDGRTVVIETHNPETGHTSREYRAPGEPGHAYFMERMHLDQAALSADTTGEKEPETMIIEPGSELDKRAEANETAVDAMSENDVRALAQALGHRITDRNGNARDTQVLRDALKQTHPDDFDAALASIQPAPPVAAAFEALHDAEPEPFNVAYDHDHHVKAAVVSAMVEAGEPYLSREARAEARAKAYASLDGKRLAFESIVFAQGDDAREPLHLLNREGEQAALDYLLQWDMGDGGELADVAPWGESDRLWGKGDLLVSYNNPLGYIGLCRVIVQG